MPQMSLIEDLATFIINASEGDPITLAFYMGLFAATMTSMGSLLSLLAGPPESMRERFDLLIDLGLGFSSGVMIVASFTSLLLPSIESYGLWETLAGFVGGAVLVHVVNSLVPHEHFVKGFEGPRDALRRLRAAWLVALAIIIHNIPEGLSIGAASAYSSLDGVAIGLAIGVQDFPEGLAVAIPVLASTNSRGLAVFIGVLSGLTEVVTSGLAAFVGVGVSGMLPYLMGLGAGAMVYVVSHESLPETHRSGHELRSTIAFFAGFLVMIVLDTAIGG